MVWMRRHSIRPCVLVGSSSGAPGTSLFQLINAERLEGFRCILLHCHQVVSVVAFDDTAGGISDCVQRVYRDNMSVKRHFFEKLPDGI